MQPFDTAQIPAAVLEVAQTLEQGGHLAYLVGGCVRDLLRGATPKDYDLATSAEPKAVQGLFKKTIPTGIQHGTVTVMAKGHPVEVTTFRTESGYVDGRRPTKVEFHGDVEGDLARRDFTINAIAYRPKDGSLVDHWGGRDDLEKRLVRCVRDPLERFNEDGLRALRAARFATVLQFELDPDTFAAIRQTLPVFRKVAKERMLQELTKLLAAPDRVRGLELLHSSGLLEEMLPEASAVRIPAVGPAPNVLEVQLAILLADAPPPSVKAALERLKLPTKVIERATQLVKLQVPPPVDATGKQVRLWVRDVGPENVDAQLAVAHALGHSTAIADRAHAARHDPLTPKQLALNGQQIMAALGLGPGPHIGEATRDLVDAVLDNPSLNTSESLTNLLKSRGS